MQDNLFRGDAGLNKPFDRLLKAFVDEAPEMFVRLLGIAPAGADLRLAALRPETAPAVVLPDFVALLQIGKAEPVILHIEFQVAYHSGIPSGMARYGGSLAWQYRREVVSLLILLRRRGVPTSIPEVGEYVIGRTATEHPFRTIRLWEVNPRPILEARDPRLLPWSVLMRSSDETVQRVAAILARDGDQESVGRFLTLGSLRYDRSQLEQMLGGPKMGLMEAILEGSSIIQEIKHEARKEGRAEGREEGRAEGRAEGREEGRAEELVEWSRVLRTALKAKFPGLELMPEIDSITRLEILRSLLELTVISSDRSEVERAICSPIHPN